VDLFTKRRLRKVSGEMGAKMGSLNISNFIWNIVGDVLRDVYVLGKKARPGACLRENRRRAPLPRHRERYPAKAQRPAGAQGRVTAMPRSLV
jgi:hypothetical protein